MAVDPDGPPPPVYTTPGLAISGSWIDDIDGVHTIAEIAYQHDPADGASELYHLVNYDNDAGWMVGQNDPGNPGFYADQWSRFDFVIRGPAVYLCHTRIDGPTQAYAESANPADAEDLDGFGCAGEPWRLLEP